MRESLFEPFVSHDPARKNGLGATIAKQVIERHNGTLNFNSEEGKGSTFQIVLPVSPDTPVNPAGSGRFS